MSNPLIESLQRAVETDPDDLPLRLHLAGLLVDAGRGDEAIGHIATALAHDPASGEARSLMARAMGATDEAPYATVGEPPRQPDVDEPTEQDPGSGRAFDWTRAEAELDGPEPMFVEGDRSETDVPAFDVERSGVRLADVGGMQDVKDRLEAGFLAPLRNPELRQLYGKSLKGGLLLYGPPGVGKTFLARAVAGELGASFIAVSLNDVLDMYIGNSERNLHEVFASARASAPCVVFLDELDALGQKRSMTRNSGLRTAVNQLLTELDGVADDNEGVFVLAATNHPWDVDPALRRPGRLDRSMLVLPPDRPAREQIFRTHLRDRPVEGIDLVKLAKRTEGYSGADLAHVCTTAAEHALLDSVRSGTTRMIGMADLEAALKEVRPSIGPWLETARNVALFANTGGEYDDLARFIRSYRG